MVAGSSFVDHSSTAVHSTPVASSDMHCGTSHVGLGSPVVFEFAFFVGVERYSGLPFLNLRRLIRVVRNFGSG